MTYFDKLKKDYPDMAARAEREGILLCPSDFDFEPYEPDGHCDNIGSCKECWAREMQEVTK